MDNEKQTKERSEVNEALKLACAHDIGVVDSRFLCQSLSVLDPAEPFSVKNDTPVKEVMRSLKDEKKGCVVVEDAQGHLVGIFSERDYVLKVYEVPGEGSTPIERYMTKDPVTVSLDDTLAYALTLMSEGGFRHLPVVDDEQRALGVISVKDVIDNIVSKIMDDMLSFETE